MKRSNTSKVELVETHNLYLSLRRLEMQLGDVAWRRALYHAACMQSMGSWNFRSKLREILELP